MRDQKRMPEILDLIKVIWEKQSDTRFNQLIHNLQVEYIQSTGETGWNVNRQIITVYKNSAFLEEDSYIDMFHLEDDKFLEWLRLKVEQLKG